MYHEIIPLDDGSFIARIYDKKKGFLMEHQGTEDEIQSWLTENMKE